jgi:hypothetical protein
VKNRYEVLDNHTVIYIERLSGDIFELLIDTEDLPLLIDGPSVYVNTKHKYAVVDKWKNGKKKSIYVHRLVTNALKGFDVDHKNHNVLDNRKVNLHVGTKSDNLQNRAGADSRSVSKVRGVSWHKKARKWVVQLTVNGEDYYLGLHTSLLEAEKVVKEARSKLMPHSKEFRDLRVSRNKEDEAA